MKYRIPLCYLIFLIVLMSCIKIPSPNRNVGMIQLISVKIADFTLNDSTVVKNVPFDQPIHLLFTSAVDIRFHFKGDYHSKFYGVDVAYTYSVPNNSTGIILKPVPLLQYSTDYTLAISSDLRGTNGETFPGLRFKFSTGPGSMVIDSIMLNGKAMTTTPLQNIDPQKINITVTFSQALNPAAYKSAFSFNGPPLSFTLSSDNKTVMASNTTNANGLTRYTFSISSGLTSAGGFSFGGFSSDFFTAD